ncbi:hypothetical protein AVEN_4516-1 [Araneus ventricosus]|uniref:Uncharacterized protein n=1 Tax=Araneus ventricosus TaxID=182803 RepID=A0A4Y2BNH1_ARAVE|nr:hypothetical protein AVEN_4516-1 [Araneus ventricosus]
MQREEIPNDHEMFKSPSPNLSQREKKIWREREIQRAEGFIPKIGKHSLQQVILFPENCLEANPSPSSFAKQNAGGDSYFQLNRTPPLCPPPPSKLECTKKVKGWGLAAIAPACGFL